MVLLNMISSQLAQLTTVVEKFATGAMVASAGKACNYNFRIGNQSEPMLARAGFMRCVFRATAPNGDG
jgi:hypothetical protein